MKKAVCALIFDNNGEILSVSRKDNPNDKNLPGGKVDEKEDLIKALRRELLEETGLTITSFEEVFHDVCGSHYAYCFKCEVTGEITTTETGIVEYITWDELLFEENSFKDYNRKLFLTVMQKQ